MNDRKINQMLVERAQRGGQKASEMLMSGYQRRLFRLVARFVKDEHGTSDVVQKAVIKTYRALSGSRGEGAFHTWLYRIAINTVKNFLITSGERPFVSAGAANEGEDVSDLPDQMVDYRTPGAEMINREILQTVETTVSKLSDDLRKAIILKEMGGSSYEEITQIMGCLIGTVRSRIFRAHEVIVKGLRPLLDVSENQR